MAENCTHDCSSCSESCASRETPQSFLEKPNELSHIKKVIGVVSGKGGVGKTMVTSLLAVEMRRRGFSVAVMDADVTGPSIPRAFGLKESMHADESGMFPVATSTGIKAVSMNLLLQNDSDPVVWRGPMIAGVVKQFWTDVVWGDVDYMFVDMPPGTGDVPLTVFQSVPVDGIVVVTSPQELVSLIVEKAVKMARLMEIPIVGLVENMAYYTCPDCGKQHSIFGESRIEETAKRFGIEKTAKLPIDPKLAGACDQGFIELFDGDWLSGMADAIEAI